MIGICTSNYLKRCTECNTLQTVNKGIAVDSFLLQGILLSTIVDCFQRGINVRVCVLGQILSLLQYQKLGYVRNIKLFRQQVIID